GAGVAAAAGSFAKGRPAVTSTNTRNATPRIMRGLKSKRFKTVQTLYQSAMKMLCASALLAFVTPFSATAKDRHCMFRLHVEANPHDTAVFSTSVRARFSGQEVAIEKVARITEHDVVAFYPYQIAKDNYGALFRLDDHHTIALDTSTVERRASM